MKRKRLIAAAIIIILVGGAYTAWRLTHPPRSNREQIYQLLDRIERGVETRSPRMILDTISPDYRDSSGFTKRDIRRLSLTLLRTQGSVQVTINDVAIRLHGRQAEVTAKGDVTLTEAGAESGEFSGSITLMLRKERGEWKIVSTSGWQGQAAGALGE